MTRETNKQKNKQINKVTNKNKETCKYERMLNDIIRRQIALWEQFVNCRNDYFFNNLSRNPHFNITFLPFHQL